MYSAGWADELVVEFLNRSFAAPDHLFEPILCPLYPPAHRGSTHGPVPPGIAQKGLGQSRIARFQFPEYPAPDKISDLEVQKEQ